MCVIPAGLRRLRPEDLELEANLGYLVRKIKIQDSI
jgi:hypothetical protein